MWVDGRRVLACLTLALAAEGHQIATIEGLADGDELHPMQRAFIAHDAFQCASPRSHARCCWAPGHNCVVTDTAGQDWMLYHAIDVNKPRQSQEHEINSRRVMLLDKIEWKDGWPFIGTPSHDERPAPAA